MLSLAGCAAHAPVEAASYVLQWGHIDLERGPDGNTVILDAPEGLVVVDTGRHRAHVQRILDHAREAGRPIAAVVNTHWHLDHTTGNRELRQAYPDLRVIATGAGEGAISGFLAPGIQRMRETIDNPAAPPDERAEAVRRHQAVTDRASFLPAEPETRSRKAKTAGRAIELRVAHAAVTEADLWLLVPDEKLAIVGDLVVAQAPFFDTGCEEGWKAALAEIEAAPWDMLIPGHGEPMTRAEFTRWRGAFLSFLDCARSDAPSAACSDRWFEQAAGFYEPAEEANVRALIAYYVGTVLRAPLESRMPYCQSAGED